MIKNYEHIDINNTKVKSIVSAALKIFTMNDYEKASTNLIIKEASVSRGILYHYFKDKQELFDYLMYYSVKKVMGELNDQTDWASDDYFDRLRNSLLYKLRIFIEFPYMLDFFGKYMSEKGIENFQAYEEQVAPGMREKFYTHNLNFSKFKENVDLDKMMMVSRLTMAGVLKMSMQVYSDKKIEIEVVMKEIDTYIDFLRNQFYKEV